MSVFFFFVFTFVKEEMRTFILLFFSRIIYLINVGIFTKEQRNSPNGQ